MASSRGSGFAASTLALLAAPALARAQQAGAPVRQELDFTPIVLGVVAVVAVVVAFVVLRALLRRAASRSGMIEPRDRQLQRP